MKTKLIFLLMLILCFSCGTNNKPVSDAQKEKIKGEVKEVADAMFKGCEEANVNMAVESFLDSPDFIYIYNGLSFNYKEVVDVLNPLFGELINQEVTITDEKYVFLDKSTVIYTTNCKFLENYKDGHAIVSDPMVVQVTFKKINNQWKAINGVESSARQNARNSETSKELNQVELMKKFAGKFKGELGKDTVVISDIKSFGISGLEANQKTLFKDKVLSEEKNVWGYDKKTDKYICARIWKDNPEIVLMVFWFTSENTCERIPYEFISNPEQATSKAIYEFKSPDLTVKTDIVNGKPVRTYSFTRVK
jgi:hypothetical protein